jgi:hypothetical protein
MNALRPRLLLLVALASVLTACHWRSAPPTVIRPTPASDGARVGH